MQNFFLQRVDFLSHQIKFKIKIITFLLSIENLLRSICFSVSEFKTLFYAQAMVGSSIEKNESWGQCFKACFPVNSDLLLKIPVFLGML